MLFFEEITESFNNMAEVAETLLAELDQAGTVDSIEVANKLGLNHQNIVGAIKSLQSLDNVSTFQM